MVWYRYASVAVVVVVLCSCSTKARQARKLVDRGIVLVETERYAEAIRLFRKAADVEPRFPDSYLQLALVYDDCLNDTSNAIATYEHFIAVCPAGPAKERAERWLADARSRNDAPTAETSIELKEQLDRKERQFEALRQQLVSRYEAQLCSLTQHLGKTQAHLLECERANAALRTDDQRAACASLLDQLTSNASATARLAADLEAKRKEAEAALNVQLSLQSIVTNLDAELKLARQAAAHTATVMMVAGEDMTRQLLAIEQERNDLQMRYTQVQDLFAKATSAIPVLASLSTTVLPSRVSELFQAVTATVPIQVASLAPAAPVIQPETPTVPRVRLEKMPVATRPAPTRPARTATRPASATVLGKAGPAKPATVSLAPSTLAPSVSTASAQPAPVRPPVSPAVAEPNLAAVTQSANSAQSYVVKPGDSLMKIARDMYGDPNKWTVIYNENRDTLERPNQLKIGQTIRIPALPSTLSAL